MNIFLLDTDPWLCAQYHCDKHVMAMLRETTQMLSTAHRFLDGTKKYFQVNGKKKVRFVLSDELAELNLPQATHINHPSTTWVRSSASNYLWALQLYTALCDQFVDRFGHEHAYASYEISTALSQLPKALKPADDPNHAKLEQLVTESLDIDWAKFPLCMPDDYKAVGGIGLEGLFPEKGKESSELFPVACYRIFYFYEKRRFAKWKLGNTPDWWLKMDAVEEFAAKEEA